MWEIYEDPTELAEFEGRLERRITKIEERLDEVEWSIYDAQEQTLERLNTPFTKWEGIILFIWWIWGNFLVSGIIDKQWIINPYSIIGISMIFLTGLAWLFLLKKR